LYHCDTGAFLKGKPKDNVNLKAQEFFEHIDYPCYGRWGPCKPSTDDNDGDTSMVAVAEEATMPTVMATMEDTVLLRKVEGANSDPESVTVDIDIRQSLIFAPIRRVPNKVVALSL